MNQGRLIRGMFEMPPLPGFDPEARDAREARDRFDPFPIPGGFGHFGAHRAHDDRFHIFMDEMENPFARRFPSLERAPQTLKDIIERVNLSFDQVCFKIFNTDE